MGSRVDRVELFEDRAAITYVAEIEAGRHALELGPVSPLTDATRTTTPRLSTDAEWVLEDIRVEHVRVSRGEAEGPRLSELRRQHHQATTTLNSLVDRRRRAADSANRSRAALRAAREGTSAALQGGESPEAWIEALRALAAAGEQAVSNEADASHDEQSVRAEVDRLSASLEEASRGESVEQARLVLQVHATTAGRIRVRTVVPCGLWRPVHRAVLDGDQVHWEVRAACWNATGVPWDDVEIVCSTARPGQHGSAPELTEDRVRTKRRSTSIVVEQREEVVEHARPGSTSVSETLPGVDDGGEARVFTAPDRVSIASDGRPVFIGLDSFATSCTSTWRAIPLHSGHAVLQTTQLNASNRPLLAGPVELVREGMSIGSGSVSLVPAGERFELGWGSHDGLFLVRKQQQDVDHATISGRQTYTFEVEIRVSHLGVEPAVLQIDERIPVSELKQVTVELREHTPTLTRSPDRDGLCGWTLQLQPGQVETLELSYRVTAPSNIALPF